MRAWIYARLSHDEDSEQNSLKNQQKICRSYAERSGCAIVGSSFDDDVSGMTFQREGLAELTVAVENGSVDAVIVKDLSRLGRHGVQTALYLDYLRQYRVRVLSVTEGIDTFREEDDLQIGVRTLLNDLYAKDIGNKIRAGYDQKLRDGLVMILPFGYCKDKNTGEIKIIEEAAETVRLIYDLYLSGHGLKAIATQMDALGRKTPAQMQKELYGKERANLKRYVWTYTSVKNILREIAYTGTFVSHRKAVRNGKCEALPPSRQIVHEGLLPVIIPQEDWRRAQERLDADCVQLSRENRPKHRYAGLLACSQCGSPFVPMNRYWNGKRRVEYVCKLYHDKGKAYCASHRIREERIDAEVYAFISSYNDTLQARLWEVNAALRSCALRQPQIQRRIALLRGRIEGLEGEIDEIMMEKITDSQGRR